MAIREIGWFSSSVRNNLVDEDSRVSCNRDFEEDTLKYLKLIIYKE